YASDHQLPQSTGIRFLSKPQFCTPAGYLAGLRSAAVTSAKPAPAQPAHLRQWKESDDLDGLERLGSRIRSRRKKSRQQWPTAEDIHPGHKSSTLKSIIHASYYKVKNMLLPDSRSFTVAGLRGVLSGRGPVGSLQSGEP